ncbi:hypothetical protein CPB84DRAFT_295253 [Gymnopilus junonius]|uniref:Uncharacterized protein n=1 Tax=Gymnopilus junonius TaxID=109634 RepID=A0A9P5TQF0_GYMJU|nr:hypothetical protein CPB84DRAFT_295253 [Gymnopilus junonius]
MFADVGHILPFWIGGRPVVYSYLRTFGNIPISFEEMRATLFKPPNSAIFDIAWRNLFNRFCISIQHDLSMDHYILRSYEPSVPPAILEHKDRPLIGLHAGPFTDIEYRLSEQFCNIHHAISKILYTSGADKVINEILDAEIGARETGLLCLREEFNEDEYGTMSTIAFRSPATNALGLTCWIGSLQNWRLPEPCPVPLMSDGKEVRY